MDPTHFPLRRHRHAVALLGLGLLALAHHPAALAHDTLPNNEVEAIRLVLEADADNYRLAHHEAKSALENIDWSGVERRIDVEWDTTTSDQAPYTVRLTMQVEDRKGMLAEISAKVSGINTNITNMEARTGDDQHARIDMTVEISDVKHLQKVIKSLRGVNGVIDVERAAR